MIHGIDSLEYRPSPIPEGGLEIALMLNFKSPRYITHTKMNEFVKSLDSYEYTGEETESGSSDDKINLLFLESSDSGVEDRLEPKKYHLLSRNQ